MFKGPITIPSDENRYVNVNGKLYTSPNQVLRKIFNLYANVRPSKSLPGVSRRFPDVDLVTVRENTECCYTGEEHWVDDNTVELTRRISRDASKRISEFGLRLAQSRPKKHATCVHKANVMKQSDGLFLHEFSHAAERFPDLHIDQQLADSLLTELVLNPAKFDVLICPNLFGDLISDLAGGLIGSLGLCPSGQYGEGYALFEPAHGSAPKIAGKDMANPVSQILSGSMMLRHLGLHKEADKIELAVQRIFEEGKSIPKDLGGSAGTFEFTKAVIAAME